MCFFFFSSRRRHTRFDCDWSSDVCSSDLVAGCDASKASAQNEPAAQAPAPAGVVRVKPESLKMLDIAVVADPQGTQMAWAPARVAFAEDRVATVSVPLAARVVSVRAHVGDIVKADRKSVV